MKYKDILDIYLEQLSSMNYSQNIINRKAGLLRNRLPLSLSLFNPGTFGLIKDITQPIYYHNKKIRPIKEKERKRYVSHFLDIYKRENEKTRYLNLNIFLTVYEKNFLSGFTDIRERLNAITGFCKALGYEIDLDTMTEKIYYQCMDYLKSSNIQRIVALARDFFIFCFERDSLVFNPHTERKSPYKRTFNSEFLGEPGTWRGYLEQYFKYLQYEKNLSEGGIDYQLRKLKILTKWMDSQKINKVDVDIIKKFIRLKKNEGIKDITLNKYLYTMKYFFNFLIEKGYIKHNPAVNIKIKYQAPSRGEVLTEIEVNKIIEYFDNIIFSTNKTKELNKMMIYFRAIRDLCLFQFFIFTGVRLSEIAKMRLKDINFTKRSILISSKGNKEYRKKNREILLNEYLWNSLQKYLKTRNYPKQDYLWISFKGSPLSNPRINKIITTGVKQAGIDKKISPHRLRATCSSLYVKKGMDPFSLKSLMGHNSIATTMDEYTELTEEELRKIWKDTNPLRGIDDE